MKTKFIVFCVCRISNIDVQQLSDTLSMCDTDQTMDMNETVLSNVIVDVVASTTVRFAIDAFAMVEVGGQRASIFSGGSKIKLNCAKWSSDLILPSQYGDVQLILELNQIM